MKQLSTICGAHQHAHWLVDRRLDRDDMKDRLIAQLVNIIDQMHGMGQRMEARLVEYRDFCHDLQETLNTVRRAE
jgi:hypothetical protein